MMKQFLPTLIILFFVQWMGAKLSLATQTFWQVDKSINRSFRVPLSSEKWESSTWSSARLMLYFNQKSGMNLDQLDSPSEYQTYRDQCPRTVDCRLINTYRKGTQDLQRLGSLLNPFSWGSSTPAQPAAEISDFSVSAIPATLTQYMNETSRGLQYQTKVSKDVLSETVRNLMKGYPVLANIKVGEFLIAKEIPSDYHQSIIDSGFSEILRMKAPETQYILITSYDYTKTEFTYINPSTGKDQQISARELRALWNWKLSITPEIATKVREFAKLSWVPWVGLKHIAQILDAQGNTLISIDESSLPAHARGSLPDREEIPEDLATLIFDK